MLDQSAQIYSRRKTGCFQYVLAYFLTGYNTTEQAWLFLFNVGSGVYVRLSRQQWTGTGFDWNIF